MEIINIIRTTTGDARMRVVKIDPNANPATAALAAVIPLEAHYLARTLPQSERGCSFPGRFDREDTARNAGWGPAPGSGPCDYPQGCEHLGSVEMHCPHKPPRE